MDDARVATAIATGLGLDRFKEAITSRTCLLLQAWRGARVPPGVTGAEAFLGAFTLAARYTLFPTPVLAADVARAARDELAISPLPVTVDELADVVGGATCKHHEWYPLRRMGVDGEACAACFLVRPRHAVRGARARIDPVPPVELARATATLQRVLHATPRAIDDAMRGALATVARFPSPLAPRVRVDIAAGIAATTLGGELPGPLARLLGVPRATLREAVTCARAKQGPPGRSPRAGKGRRAVVSPPPRPARSRSTPVPGTVPPPATAPPVQDAGAGSNDARERQLQRDHDRHVVRRRRLRLENITASIDALVETFPQAAPAAPAAKAMLPGMLFEGDPGRTRSLSALTSENVAKRVLLHACLEAGVQGAYAALDVSIKKYVAFAARAGLARATTRREGDRDVVVQGAIDGIAAMTGAPVDEATRASITRFHRRWHVHLDPLRPDIATGVVAMVFASRLAGTVSASQVMTACGVRGLTSSVQNALRRFLNVAGAPARDRGTITERTRAWLATQEREG